MAASQCKDAYISHAVCEPCKCCCATAGVANLVLDILAQMQNSDMDNADGAGHRRMSLLIVGKPGSGIVLPKSCLQQMHQALTNPSQRTCDPSATATTTSHIALS